MKLAATTAAATAATGAIGAVVVFEPLPTFGHGARREDEIFVDCDVCPEMLPIEPGVFVMGDAPRRRDVMLAWFGGPPTPVRTVTVSEPFALGRTEVTFAQWDACVADGGCGGHVPDDQGWGRGDRPVIDVTWLQAQSYVAWLSEETGLSYRLPTEAEWEYAARAGTRTPYPWGKRASRNQANYGGPECPPCEGAVGGRDVWMETAPVGSFPPNRWGLHDMNANVYEWVEDCFAGLPPGPAGAAAVLEGNCASRGIRGSAWYSNAPRIASPRRAYAPQDGATWGIGFRVARDL
jgi:formylglycine-generating enzyme required for sulfatase activity